MTSNGFFGSLKGTGNCWGCGLTTGNLTAFLSFFGGLWIGGITIFLSLIYKIAKLKHIGKSNIYNEVKTPEIQFSNWSEGYIEKYGLMFLRPSESEIKPDKTYSNNSIDTYLVVEKDEFHQIIFLYEKFRGESLENWHNRNFPKRQLVSELIEKQINGYNGLEVIYQLPGFLGKSILITKNNLNNKIKSVFHNNSEPYKLPFKNNLFDCVYA